MRRILRGALIVVSSIVLTSLAVGEQGQDQRATKEPKHKPSVAKPTAESDGHKFARLRYEYAVESRDETMQERDDVIKRSIANEEVWRRYTTEEQEGVIAKVDRLKEQTKDAQTLVEVRATQVEHADECASVYRSTIDRKNADLTVRQTEHIASCKALDLYPPAVR
jgi:hypothetical protein